jgi:hypothetical protein
VNWQPSGPVNVQVFASKDREQQPESCALQVQQLVSYHGCDFFVSITGKRKYKLNDTRKQFKFQFLKIRGNSVLGHAVWNRSIDVSKRPAASGFTKEDGTSTGV